MEIERSQNPLKVLIADDDPPTRILLKAAISQWGYVTVETKDGEEAWEVLQLPEAPHLLIVDWLMPKLNGTELCTRIRKGLSFQPYIILLTQVSGSSNIIIGLEAGADEFLSKPFNMAELRSRLSVGARIVKYENELAKHHSQLQICLKQLSSLVELMTEITAKIHALLPMSNDPSQQTNINELYEKLEQVNLALNNFPLGKNTKG